MIWNVILSSFISLIVLYVILIITCDVGMYIISLLHVDITATNVADRTYKGRRLEL